MNRFKTYASADKARAIMVDTEEDSIIFSYGMSNVLACAPAGLIETEELTETNQKFAWTQSPGVLWIRKRTGLSQTEFGKVYGIPMRSIQNWEGGKSECPEYVKRLLMRAVLEDFPI